MASASFPWRYDVFPSFCGKDVRRTFLSHFLKEFKRHGIEVFVDHGIPRGKAIGSELVKAIKESRVPIVVLSRNYVSSSWCLNELLEILKCREVVGKTVMSIFYEVDPSDVRKQTGDVAGAFEEACAGKTEEEKQKWRLALTEVANIAGVHSQNWDNEAEMIEKIARDVMNELKSTPSRDFDGFVGMEAHMMNMNPLLCLDSIDVRMIGIWGPAGIGKTTIARSLYDQMSSNFQVSLFMENVKGSYRRTDLDDYGSKLRLQERFLSEIVDQRDMRIQHLGLAQERLKYKKVLLVLDDVDELEQLNALANQTRWFGPESRIIVTTKDKQLLRSHEINHIYEVGFPSRGEALQIFCQSAFRQNSPPDEFQDIAVEITDLAGQLPLSLNVLGSSLRGKHVDEWKLALPRLRTSLDGKIEKTLRIGYDGLHDKDKVIFLHIACLFSGEKVDYITQFLTNTDLDVGFGLKVLADKSLVHITEGNYVVMHYLLQQMGKEIVRRQSIHDPGKRQFLVNAKEICDVLADNTGTRAVLGLSLDLSEVDELFINERAFEEMPNLLFLRFYNNLFADKVRLSSPQSLDYLSRKLRILHWDAYPMKCMPLRFHPEFLVELDMQNSKLEKLWEGTQPLASLKWMNLRGSKKLEEFPDLTKATNLEVLYLDHCESLVTLPSSINNLKNLSCLHMEGCIRLEALPTDVNLESLSYLDLKSCSRLRQFPMISSNVIKIWLRSTAIEQAPASFMFWSRLSRLDMSGCQNLKTFPLVPITVELLDLCMTGIEEIPSWIGNLSRLQTLRMRYCKNLRDVSPAISKLQHLEELDFSGCKNVVSFPAEIFQISCLVLRLHAINDESVPTSLPHKDLTSPIALNMANNDMKTIPKSINSLSQLCCLILANCRNLVSVPKLPDSLLYLTLNCCVSLERIPHSFTSPEIILHLGNCLKLDQEVRLLVQQAAFKHALLPGGEVPTFFTHRAEGSSLTIHSDRTPLPTFLGFKACVVLATEARQNVLLIEGLSVSCRFRGSKHDVLYEWPKVHPYPLLANHLYILDSAFFMDEDEFLGSESTQREMLFEFSCNRSKIIECGVRLFEASTSLDGRRDQPASTSLDGRQDQPASKLLKGKKHRMKEYYETGYWRLISRPVMVTYLEESTCKDDDEQGDEN